MCRQCESDDDYLESGITNKRFTRFLNRIDLEETNEEMLAFEIERFNVVCNNHLTDNQCKKLRTACRQYQHKQTHGLIRVDLTVKAHQFLAEHFEISKNQGQGENLSDAVIDVFKKLKC